MSEPQPDQGTNEHLDTLVGEGKKYADADNLAKGYANLEAHTETIKLEKLALEEKLGIKTSQDNHLETIVSLLSPSVTEPEPEPAPTPDPVPVINEPIIPEVSIQDKMNMEQFAKDAVAAYGNADTVGKHLQAYMGDDKGRQALVNTMMRTDPSALLKILPAKDKSFNPTGSEGTPQTNASLPLTWEDCVKVRKDNPVKFASAAFTKQMMSARVLAKSKGISFEST